jgi:hypothetical protein
MGVEGEVVILLVIGPVRDGEVVAVFVVPDFFGVCSAALDLKVEASPFLFLHNRDIICNQRGKKKLNNK